MRFNHKPMLYILIAGASIALSAQAGSSEEVTQQFHHQYSVAPDGRIILQNINGNVQIKAWDSSNVQVDAITHADSREKLDLAVIQVETHKKRIEISTKYMSKSHPWDQGAENAASVDYTLWVPHNIRVDANLVNGDLKLEDLTGEVRGSSINGRVMAAFRSVSSQADRAPLAQSRVQLNSVKGSLEITLPSNADAYVQAKTLRGEIRDDFGIEASDSETTTERVLRVQLGDGGGQIRLQNVDGNISILRDADGLPLTTRKNLTHVNEDVHVLFLSW